jgi:non-specific protein-tyrosine kinase
MYAQNAAPTSNDFDLRASLVVLRRRRWTLLLVIIAVLAVGAVSSYRKSPVYQTTALALLKAGAADSVIAEQLSSDPERRVQNEAQLITSAETAQAVAEELGFSASVSVSAGGVDDVLEISATDGDPARAALVANTYAEVHRDRRAAENRRAVTEARDEVQQSLDQVEADAAANSQALVQLNQQRAITTDPAQIAALDTQISENQQIQQTLSSSSNAYSTQLSELKTQEGLIASSPPIEILAPAGVPSSPISPNHRQDLTVVLVLGVLLGIGVVFVQEHLDDTIRVIDDVAASTRNLPSLAVVPLHTGEPGRTIVTATQPMSHTAEAYRSLRTSVEFLALENDMQTIQVTSAQAGEGKTTCVVNLAVAFAQAGKSVIVVDCDLRRPRLHEYFGFDRHVGFTSVLLHESRLESVVRTTTEFPDLAVLCAGPLAPNPSELLGSEGFAEIIKSLTGSYSVVLIDSPPVLPVTDALVLSRVVDATIFLTSSGFSSKRRVHRSVDSLRQVGAPLVGTVLSAAPHEVAYGYVDYGYVDNGHIAYGPSSSGRGESSGGRSKKRQTKATK